MGVKRTPPPRFVIVAQSPQRSAWPWRIGLALLWAATLLAAWQWGEYRAAPGLGDARVQLERLQREYARQTAELADLRQRKTAYTVSEKISRTANLEMQRTLTERDEEIANLRENLAFYERLVGATGKAEGLGVHSAEFQPEAGGTWRYRVTLTQSLNRGAVSSGALKLAVEGVRDGRLTSIGWNELHQKRAVPPQRYSFRYFQQLEGSIMLPAGFTPQRVRVQLSGGGTPVERTFAWDDAASTASDARVATVH